MIFRNAKSLGAAIAAAVFASIALLPQAKGELVYESDLQQQQQQPAAAQNTARVDDRAALRQALGASEKAQATLQASAPAPVAQQVVVSAAVPMTAPVAAPVPAPVTAQVNAVPAGTPVAAASGDAEIQNLSKAELMRRERMREEMKNEDILQERLEELRLRDERHRTDQLLGADAGTGAVQAPAPAPVLKDEVVVAPVTDRPGQPAPVVTAPAAAAPVNAMSAQTSAPAYQQDQLAVSRASATAVLDQPADRTLISITPRAGLANMSGGQSYDIKPHYSAGIGAALSVSDNVSFELGYEYSEYGVALNSTNPFAINYQAVAAAAGYTGQYESVAMKQNVIDAGLKIHFLGPDAKLRPFIGGGAAYAKSFVNYDSSILAAMNQAGYGYLGQDYQLTSYLGYVSTGLDVRVNKSISVGAQFKYYAVLSSRENTNLNNLALYGYNPAGLAAYPYGYGLSPYGSYGAMSDADKQLVGGSLAQSGFYLITGGVTFTF